MPPGRFPDDPVGVSVALPCAIGTTGHAWIDLCAHGSDLALHSLLSSVSALLQMVNYPLLLCVCAKANCRLPLWLSVPHSQTRYCASGSAVTGSVSFCLFLARVYLAFGCVIVSHSKQEDGRRDGLLVGSR